MDELAAKERAKYEKMWAVDDYRKRSPAERVIKQAQNWMQATPHPDYANKFYDFGCGTGRAAKRLFDLGFDVQMIDITPDCLDPDVRASLCDHFTFKEACLWDEDLELPKRDYAICCDVMEHIPEEKVEDVLVNIAKSSTRVYFSITMTRDGFGKQIGEPLHLTVKTPNWWLDRLYATWADVRCNPGGSTMLAACTGPRSFKMSSKNLLDLVNMGTQDSFTLGTKRVALLCPGPSLSKTWDEGKAGLYDYVVGVNRAPTNYVCSHWVALDSRLQQSVSVIGDPTYVGSKSAAGNNLAKRFGFSTLVALAYSVNKLGACHLDVYGNDMVGFHDFDGTSDPRNNRTRKRWEKEREGYRVLCEYFTERGVKINRIQPQTVCGNQ